MCGSEWVCFCKRVVSCVSWTFCVWYVLVFYASVLVSICMSCTYLTWGVLVLCSGIVCWWCGIRVQAEPLMTCSLWIVRVYGVEYGPTDTTLTLLKHINNQSLLLPYEQYHIEALHHHRRCLGKKEKKKTTHARAPPPSLSLSLPQARACARAHTHTHNRDRERERLHGQSVHRTMQWPQTNFHEFRGLVLQIWMI